MASERKISDRDLRDKPPAEAPPAFAGHPCGSSSPNFAQLAAVLRGDAKHPGIQQSGGPGRSDDKS